MTDTANATTYQCGKHGYYSGEPGEPCPSCAVEAARRLRERTDTGEGAPVVEGWVVEEKRWQGRDGEIAHFLVSTDERDGHDEPYPVTIVRRHQPTNSEESNNG